MFKQYPLVGVGQLVPIVKITQVVAILFFQKYSIYTEVITYTFTAYRFGIEQYLLKKWRIL